MAINPTSRNLTWIKEYIAGLYWRPLSPVQQSARAELRGRLATADITSFFKSSDEVKALAKCLIDLLFGDGLFERCEFILASPNTMQVHAVRIVINPDDNPYAPQQAARRYLDVLETLLHEICHGILITAVERGSLTPWESAVYMGICGHGTLFVALFQAVAYFLGKHTNWIIDVDAACSLSARRDRDMLAEAQNIWQHICRNPQESARTYAGLGQLLIKNPGDDMRLLYLIREGRDVLELVLIMRLGAPASNWRRPLQTPRLDQAQRSPHSFIVEAWSR